MAVVLAMMNVIIAENLYNKEFVEKYTVGFAELAEHVKQYTPEWAEKNQKSQRLRFTGLPGNLQKMETNRLGRYTTKKGKYAPKRQQGSVFDYESAGGSYAPTTIQYNAAYELLNSNPTRAEIEACNFVIAGYLDGSKVHHDYIHMVNEYIRSKKWWCNNGMYSHNIDYH